MLQRGHEIMGNCPLSLVARMLETLERTIRLGKRTGFGARL